MKKFTFILAALFAATFANAQITLEHTFSGTIDAPLIAQDVFGDYYVVRNTSTNTVTVYNANDYSVIWSITAPKVNVNLFSSNIFTTDGKFACLVRVVDETKTDQTRTHLYVYNEDNTVIADLGTSWDYECSYFVKLSTGYKLLVEKVDSDFHFSTDLYSLPGNGEPSTDIVTTSSPKRSARKIARDGQVLIETETNTYTLQGAEVK